jgi:hypothetical protein
MGNRLDPNLGKGISVSKSRVMRVLVMDMSPNVARLITHRAGQQREHTGDQVLVERVHGAHVIFLNLKASNLRVLNDPLFLRTFG